MWKWVGVGVVVVVVVIVALVAALVVLRRRSQGGQPLALAVLQDGRVDLDISHSNTDKDRLIYG